MKIRKLFVGFTAAALAASCMAISVSAAKLGDVVYPTEEDAAINDAYYSIGAMAFYMNQTWSWNQSDWIGISDDGKLEINYSISEVITDTTMSGKGNLGDMGVMVMNLPEDGYPYEVTISDAKFTANDGTVTELSSVNAITEATLDAEGGFRIHIRPTDEVNEETGEVTKKACPEVAGWDEEGSFKGGTLSMTIDFGIGSESGDSSSAADESSKKDDSSANEDSSQNDDSSAKDDSSSKKDTSTASTSSSAAKTSASGSASSAAAPDNANAETGAGEFAFAGLALAAAALVVSKRNK